MLNDPNAWASLLTLTVMEIVLGIDNLVFVAILTERLPAHRRAAAQRLGLTLALVTRLGLLAGITWLMALTQPLLHSLSGRDLILIGGGLFLVYKGTTEIHHRLEDSGPDTAPAVRAAGFAGTLLQIMILDIVFSLDSVITAVGMSGDLIIMMAAVVIAVIAMVVAAAPLSAFISRHPTVKMLALSFLLLIGMTLIAEGSGTPVPKGYIYAAMAFAGAVEALNLAAARRRRGTS